MRIFVWLGLLLFWIAALLWQRDRDYVSEADVIRARREGL